MTVSSPPDFDLAPLFGRGETQAPCDLPTSYSVRERTDAVVPSGNMVWLAIGGWALRRGVPGTPAVA